MTTTPTRPVAPVDGREAAPPDGTAGGPLAVLLALPRLTAQRGVLAAVLVGIVLATTLLAAGPVVSGAVTEAGLDRALRDAPPSEVGLEVTAQVPVDDVPEVVADMAVAVEQRTAGGVTPLDVVVEGSSVRVDGTADDVVVPVAVLVTDGLLEVVERADTPPGPVTARLHVDAAEALGVEPGDVLATSGGVAVVLEATVRPVQVSDPRWWDRPEVRDGVVVGQSFTEVGPLLLSDVRDVTALTGDSRLAVRGRALADPDALGPADLPVLGRRVAGLEDVLVERLDGRARTLLVRSGLPDATVATAGALTATRAAVLSAVGQVAVLALYALGLAGRLLRSGRSVETALVRARGATPRQLGTAAFAEGLVLVVPAVLLAPWLAVVATRLLGRLPFVTDAGLALQPRAGVASLLLALLAGVACLAVLVAPAVTDARRAFAGVRSSTTRRDVRQVAQRHGLDLALVGVAVLGVWQLRRSGGPVARAVGGAADVDPVLVIAPALGLLAGALLVLRVVPLLARGGEALATRGRSLVGALGGWQVARRPDLVTRPALLLVLAVAVGVLAGTYGATWTRSQGEQAAAEVGGDVVLEPDQRPVGLAPWLVGGELRATEGVGDATATWSSQVRLLAGGPVGLVLAGDPGALDWPTRGDVSPSVDPALLDVAPVAGLDLPDGAGEGLLAMASLSPDPRWPDTGVAVRPVVRDGDGAVHLLDPARVDRGGAERVRWDLAGLAPPLAVLAWEIEADTGPVEDLLPLIDPAELEALGLVGGTLPDPAFAAQLAGVEARGPLVDLALRDLSVDGTPVAFDDVEWAPDDVLVGGSVPPVLDRVEWDGERLVVVGEAGIGGPRARSVDLLASVDTPAGQGAVPALVSPGVLDATGRQLGEVLGVTVGGAPLDLELVGTAPLVPGLPDEDLAVVVDLDAVSTARWVADRVPTAPTGWRLDLAPGDGPVLAAADEVAARVAAAPVQAPSVRTLAGDAAERRSDPIAVGLLVALVLGAVAALALAAVGTLSTAAVALRERAGELALLQAVGTTVRQLRAALAGEVAVVVLVGVLGGGLLGAGLVWAVLPTVALAVDGTPAVPGPVVTVPWTALLAGLAGVLALLAGVPLLLARSVARQHVADVLRLGEDA